MLRKSQHALIVGDTGLEPEIANTCGKEGYEKHHATGSAKSGSPNNQSAIPADLAMVIDAWEHLSAKAKRDILVAVKHEEAKWTESTSPYIGEPLEPAQTFPSRSSEELFSESEWSRLVDHLALPERQAGILYLLIHGKNDKQIARKLKISQPTLRTHLQRMYGRFNVSNRTSLVVELVRLARDLLRRQI